MSSSTFARDLERSLTCTLAAAVQIFVVYLPLPDSLAYPFKFSFYLTSYACQHSSCCMLLRECHRLVLFAGCKDEGRKPLALLNLHAMLNDASALRLNET